MAISQNFPNTRPSLNLNFVRSKTLDPRITFIRTQTGSEASYADESGIIRYASADEPRFDHDPETGRCLGLMIEEQRINLCHYGTTIQNFTYRGSGSVTKTANATTAPDETTTATRLEGDGVNTPYFDDNSNKTYTSGVTYTFSCFFKANGTDEVYILLYGTNWNGSGGTNVVGHFDLGDGSLISASGGSEREPTGGAKIESYPNDWYRCSITETCSTTHTANHQFIRPVGASADIYAWGYQIEAEKDISSLIPTTTDQEVTRNSDNVWMSDISDFFNPSEGTSVVKYSPRFDTTANDQYYHVFSFRDTTTGFRIGISGSGTHSYFTDYDDLIDSAEYTYVGVTYTRNKLETNVVSYGSTYFRLYKNDQQPWSSTSATYGAGKIEEYIPHKTPSTGITTSNFTTLAFGFGQANTSNRKLNCNIESFTYYPSEVGVDNIKTFTRDQ